MGPPGIFAPFFLPLPTLQPNSTAAGPLCQSPAGQSLAGQSPTVPALCQPTAHSASFHLDGYVHSPPCLSVSKSQSFPGVSQIPPTTQIHTDTRELLSHSGAHSLGPSHASSSPVALRHCRAPIPSLPRSARKGDFAHVFASFHSPKHTDVSMSSRHL